MYIVVERLWVWVMRRLDLQQEVDDQAHIAAQPESMGR